MKLNIFWNGIEATESDQKLVEERLAVLDNLVKRLKEDLKLLEVAVKKQSRFGFEVKLDMQLPGRHVFATEVHENLETAIVSAREKLEGQIREYMEKLRGE